MVVGRGVAIERAEAHAAGGFVAVVAGAGGHGQIGFRAESGEVASPVMALHVGVVLQPAGRIDEGLGVVVEQPDPGILAHDAVEGHQGAADRVVEAVGVAVGIDLAAASVADGPAGPPRRGAVLIGQGHGIEHIGSQPVGQQRVEEARVVPADDRQRSVEFTAELIERLPQAGCVERFERSHDRAEIAAGGGVELVHVAGDGRLVGRAGIAGKGLAAGHQPVLRITGPLFGGEVDQGRVEDGEVAGNASGRGEEAVFAVVGDPVFGDDLERAALEVGRAADDEKVALASVVDFHLVGGAGSVGVVACDGEGADRVARGDAALVGDVAADGARALESRAVGHGDASAKCTVDGQGARVDLG